MQASASQEQIAAIALGVESRINPSSTTRELITARTVHIAQLLGIAEEEIHKWLASNIGVDTKKSKIIEQSRNIIK